MQHADEREEARQCIQDQLILHRTMMPALSELQRYTEMIIERFGTDASVLLRAYICQPQSMEKGFGKATASSDTNRKHVNCLKVGTCVQTCFHCLPRPKINRVANEKKGSKPTKRGTSRMGKCGHVGIPAWSAITRWDHMGSHGRIPAWSAITRWDHMGGYRHGRQ